MHETRLNKKKSNLSMLNDNQILFYIFLELGSKTPLGLKKIEHDPLITLYEPRYQKPTISSNNKTRKAMPNQPKNNTRRQLPTQIPQPQQ